MGAVFDPSIPGTFCLGSGSDFCGLYFRRIERRTGGPGNQSPNQRGIWWDVEITVTRFVPTDPGTTNPGHLEVVSQRTVPESSWLSVVSSMGAAGETTHTYGIALALHRAGNV